MKLSGAWWFWVGTGTVLFVGACREECAPDVIADGTYEVTRVHGFEGFDLTGATGTLGENHLTMEIPTGGGWTAELDVQQANDLDLVSFHDVNQGYKCVLPDTSNAMLLSLVKEPEAPDDLEFRGFLSKVAFVHSFHDTGFRLSDINNWSGIDTGEDIGLDLRFELIQ